MKGTAVLSFQGGRQRKGQSFKPLHCVTDGAPRNVVAASFPSPRPSPARGEGVRSRPLPGLGEITRERIEPEPQIIGQRTKQRSIACPAISPRHPRKRDQRLCALPSGRPLAEHMQTIADLQFLQVADVRIELSKRAARLALEIKPEVLVEAVPLREVGNLGSDQLRAARIARFGRGIFVDQRFERRRWAVALGARHRRHQMVHDDSRRPPLGLRALARIVDDERIDHRQRTERRFRITALRKRQRLPRQPFEIAMLAHVHERVGGKFLAEPEVEGEIGMRRDEIGIVIAGLWIDAVATRRLNADRDIAEAMRGKDEGFAFDERIGGRRRPSGR